MGFESKMLYDLHFEMLFHKLMFKFFITTTKIAIGYIELTPFNKGNLWKIRKFYGYYHVYYGTKKICYCSTILSVYKIVNKLPNQ